MTRALLVAYLDPGTGSMVLQVLIGGVLGGVLVLRIFWKRIVRFLTGKKDDAASAGERQDGASK